jgi:hypothetical protein
MNARARNHSVVAEQWVCAWLRPQTVRVPSPKSRQKFQTTARGRATKSSVADRSLKERGGEHLSTRHLVAEKGEPGEDHSECISDQQLQPGVVEGDQPLSPHHPTRSANRRIQWKAPPKAKGRGQSRVEDPGDINGSGRGFPESSIAVRPKASRILDVWEICWGDPDLGWLAQSSVDVFGHATTHRIQRL